VVGVAEGLSKHLESGVTGTVGGSHLDDAQLVLHTPGHLSYLGRGVGQQVKTPEHQPDPPVEVVSGGADDGLHEAVRAADEEHVAVGCREIQRELGQVHRLHVAGCLLQALEAARHHSTSDRR
jgi:hypothetical protein